MIGFNRPFVTGDEETYCLDAIASGKLSGGGKFTKLCQEFFVREYAVGKALMTTSCTDALEMAAILSNIQPGDEVVLPSFTFVSTANAFVLRGAKIIFADSQISHPNIDAEAIEALISERTKALVVVHYAGVACDMKKISNLCRKYGILLIEDAAQAIDSYFEKDALGSFGDFGAFSFHETKNIVCGEGGMLAINDSAFFDRAEIIWEKGTNRAAFHRGEVAKYEWVDIGSSFLPSELNSAFLWAQLQHIEAIQKRRVEHWFRYMSNFSELERMHGVEVPYLPRYATQNGHMFYLVTKSFEERGDLIRHLEGFGIRSVFHYLTLHDSPFFSSSHDGRHLPNSIRYSQRLLRLPMFVDLTNRQIDFISEKVLQFYSERN
ncbi:UNVERIFIED_CONTAM: hypothetical protein GTU68_025430 [Idotea baltica]|nr:hypothetical protein [Idotea baltica]